MLRPSMSSFLRHGSGVSEALDARAIEVGRYLAVIGAGLDVESGLLARHLDCRNGLRGH